MNEQQQKEFQEFCYACKQEDVWRAGILHTLREMNDSLVALVKLLDDKASFANRTFSTMDCRLQTIENNVIHDTKFLDSIDSHVGGGQ